MMKNSSNNLAPILLVALTCLLTACGDRQGATYQGYVEGEFVYVASPIAGRLDHLHVKRGMQVVDDKLLFALESVDELEEQRQADQMLKSAISQLEDLKTGKRPAELDVIRAQVKQAKANANKSADQLKRDEEQFAAGGISKAQLDDTRYLHESNMAKVKEMQSQLVSANLPARVSLINAQRAQVDASKASLAQATWKLNQKSIFATRDGLVFDTLFREGEWVPAGSPVVQLLPPENIKVRFFVPQPRVQNLKIGQNLKIYVDGKKSSIDAVLTYISTQAEYTPPVIYSNETRAKLTYMVEAHPNKEAAALLHPGQPIEVFL